MDAAITRLRMPFAAVDRDVMPALHQPRGKLFGEGLKSSIPGGNSARAENRDASHLRLGNRLWF